MWGNQELEDMLIFVEAITFVSIHGDPKHGLT